MDQETKQLLEKTYKLVEENNNIVKSLRRTHRWQIAMRLFYWIIILGVSFGAFYYIQPYINTLAETYSNLQTDLNNVKNVTNKVTNFGR